MHCTLHPSSSNWTIICKIIQNCRCLEFAKHHAPSGFDNTLRLHGFNRHLRYLNGLQGVLIVKAFGSFTCGYDLHSHKLKNLLSNLNSSVQHDQLQEWCLSFVGDVQVNVTNILAVIGGLNEHQNMHQSNHRCSCKLLSSSDTLYILDLHYKFYWHHTTLVLYISTEAHCSLTGIKLYKTNMYSCWVTLWFQLLSQDG